MSEDYSYRWFCGDGEPFEQGGWEGTTPGRGGWRRGLTRQANYVLVRNLHEETLASQLVVKLEKDEIKAERTGMQIVQR